MALIVRAFIWPDRSLLGAHSFPLCSERKQRSFLVVARRQDQEVTERTRGLKVLATAPLIDAISLAYFQYISQPKKEAEPYAAGAVLPLRPTFVGIESF
ncbi:hypothetical protein CP49_23805 [Bradyrhizobium valentinum]|uniref:Uncharacterized protein n=1 Tax=Bradyrhizobium valentinum TaxID=1518501 RepID=A0A0R3L8G1_9BRAD|nr:hypothetical protein CP49_23805 [Bradyrhizobium valentinum]